MWNAPAIAVTSYCVGGSSGEGSAVRSGGEAGAYWEEGVVYHPDVAQKGRGSHVGWDTRKAS